MKKLIAILAYAVSIIFTSQIAYSQNNDGQWLLDTCNPAVKYLDKNLDLQGEDAAYPGICAGYLLGIDDINSYSFTSMKFTHDASPRYCPPKNSNFSQIARIIVKYLKNNPEKLHLPAVTLALTALHDAWPCENNS